MAVGTNIQGRTLDSVRYPQNKDDAANKDFVLGPWPLPFVYGAAITLDVSDDANFAMSNAMTGDMTIALSNGHDGHGGVIALVQDNAGGHKITAVTAAGRTILMRDDLTTINTAAFTTASAKSLLTYQYATVNGVAVVFLSIMSGVAAAFT